MRIITGLLVASLLFIGWIGIMVRRIYKVMKQLTG